MEENKPHKRRVHYSGAYPKRFEEKYKEQNPEKYKETVEKVISKGSTPAGMHIPIMVGEILSFLDIKPGQIGLDCTLGYGGHSSKMLEKLEGEGHLYALDADPIEIEKTRARMEEKGYGDDIFTAINTNFRNIDEIAGTYGPFDFVLADLGVSRSTSALIRRRARAPQSASRRSHARRWRACSSKILTSLMPRRSRQKLSARSAAETRSTRRLRSEK